MGTSIIYILGAMFLALVGLVSLYGYRTAKAKANQQQKLRVNQRERERLAERRIAHNGGRPLSSTSTPPVYPDGSRRPGQRIT